MRARVLFVLCSFALIAVPVPGAEPPLSMMAPMPVWVASWGASQQIPEPQNALPADDLRDATVRQIFHLSVGGAAVRVHLSNAFGTEALHFTSVHVAHPVSASSPALSPGSDRALTFAGNPDVAIPPGAEIISDPVAIPVEPLSDIAVTFHLDEPPAQETGHPGSRATSYSVHGDVVSAADLTAAKRVDHWFQVSGIDVEAEPGAAAAVALGDSITDGHGATTNGNDRWTDVLAARLQSSSATREIGVLNQGIGGNHLLTDGLGPNALARFDRDVLAPAGVRWVIVFEGVNDLGGLSRNGEVTPAEHAAMVQKVIAAYEQLIARAHAHGLRVYGATITPYVGSEYYHPGPLSEADRQAVNAWIRAAGHFDSTIDFDALMRDPQHPDRLLPAYDCGDHLHPLPAGYKAMADAIPLSLFNQQQEVAAALDTTRPAKAATVQTIEFADNPDFTIAGVTDWTAAGGHGSDVSLRTSEALNRETLRLKPDDKAKGAPPIDAERETKLREAAEAAPGSFDANRQLGVLYLRDGRYRKAEPLLEKAYELNSGDAVNEADLALVLKETGDLTQAREHIDDALIHGDSADAHRIAGTIYETSGDPLRAVREFGLAFRLDPSEQNVFAWGEELLQHRAVLQAKEVFEQGVKLYPKSARLLTSLGAALFAGAFYEQSAERLCEASDLEPANQEPYQFMGKIEVVAPHFASCMDARLARYVELFPNDSLANYFYAMDLWKQQGPSLEGAMLQKVESLLTKAVSLDAKCSDGFLQLGNLKSSEKDYPAAIDFYAKSIGADPQSSEAHYRLGMAYDRIGEREKAKQEFAVHDAINQQLAADTERQRKEIKQFVVEAEKSPATPPTQ